MKRLPKQRLYRGLIKAGLIQPSDIALLDRRLTEHSRYQQLNVHFTENRGHRWANRLQSFARWLFQNREAIFRILGLVVMFADDGTPNLKDAEEFDREKELAKAKKRRQSRTKKQKYDIGAKVNDEVQPREADGEAVGGQEPDDVQSMGEAPLPHAEAFPRADRLQ